MALSKYSQTKKNSPLCCLVYTRSYALEKGARGAVDPASKRSVEPFSTGNKVAQLQASMAVSVNTTADEREIYLWRGPILMYMVCLLQVTDFNIPIV